MKKRFILIVVFLLVISQFSFGDNNNRFRAFIYDFNLVPNLVSGDIGFSLSAQKPAKYIRGSGTANYIPKFTDAMTIGNSAIYEKDGKVGIGTTSPVGKLTVHTGINDGIYLRDTSNNYKVKILNAYEGDGVIELVNAIPSTGVSLKSGGDSYFTGGNVGIGTTRPKEKLYINGNLGFKTGANRYIKFPDNLKSLFIGSSTSEKGPYAIHLITHDGTSGKGKERISILGDKVGIGTTSPKEKLVINGNLGFKTGANRYIKFPDNLKSLFIGSSTSEKGPYAIHLITHDGTSGKGKERISILGDKVGIGTTNPDDGKLEVHGEISTGHGGLRWKLFSGTTGYTSLSFSHGLDDSRIYSISCVLCDGSGSSGIAQGFRNSESTQRRFHVGFGSGTLFIWEIGSDFDDADDTYRCIVWYVD